MKHTDSFSWKRLWRTSLALLLVLSMVLCGCSTAGNGDGDGTKPAENNALLGDGDGRLEAQDAVDSITNIYGALLGAFGGNRKPDTAVEMELVLTPGEKLKDQPVPLKGLGGCIDDLLPVFTLRRLLHFASSFVHCHTGSS